MINSRKELYDFLNAQDFSLKKDSNLSSVYFLVEYNGKVEPIYFTAFMDVFFESPCTLYHTNIDIDKIPDYVRDTYEEDVFDDALIYTLSMYKDGVLYEIENFQCEPFLPDKIDSIKMISETECLNWLLRQRELEQDR